jgi:hypothetical protein
LSRRNAVRLLERSRRRPSSRHLFARHTAGVEAAQSLGGGLPGPFECLERSKFGVAGGPRLAS